MIQKCIYLFMIKAKENVNIGNLFPTLLEEKKEAKNLIR